jgi:ABC-2 type transport system permease protein
MTGGLMAAARDDLPASLLALAQIWSNGLILFVIAAAVAKRVYRPAFNRLAGSGFKRTVYGSSLLDRLMEWSVFYLNKPTRILVVKDFRTFRRDPTQWVLLILFAAMMLLGGINFRSTTGANLAAIDSYVLGMVNLAASGVLLCAGLSRFVFPLMSLEGRKFWILGLLPIARSQILKGKFAFAATGAVVILLSLILASDLMLGIPPWLMLCHAVAAMCVALALAGINVGLGAYLPNFRETDPSKIVVGFGGTVNMVIGLMVMLLLLLIAAGPPHAAVAIARLRGQPETVNAWAFAGLPVAIVLSLIAMRWPMKLGGRALETVEF